MARKQKTKSAPKLRRYADQHWMDRGLDALLLVGVAVSLSILLVELFTKVSPNTLSLFRKIDVIVLGIFVADLSRAFFKSGNLWTFLKHQWLDLTIITIAIVAFSTVAFVGAGRLSWLLREERVIMLVEEERALSWVGRIWRVSVFRKIFRF